MTAEGDLREVQFKVVHEGSYLGSAKRNHEVYGSKWNSVVPLAHHPIEPPALWRGWYVLNQTQGKATISKENK